jgi:hypothetical protein
MQISTSGFGVTQVEVEPHFRWGSLNDGTSCLQRIDLFPPDRTSDRTIESSDDQRRQWWLRLAVAIITAVDQPGPHTIDLPMGQEVAYTVGVLEHHIARKAATSAGATPKE